MNPETNRFEKFTDKEIGERVLSNESEIDKRIEALQKNAGLIRPDGTPVPKHWSVFTMDEDVVIKGYTFRVKYIGETAILFEPVGPVVVGEKDQNDAETT